jgi:DNA glycosylase AlkZ-like
VLDGLIFLNPHPILGTIIKASWSQVAAFRLSRHHLSKRAPPADLGTVAGEMTGAQAQVLSAAQTSLWTRVRVRRIEEVDAALWKEKTLVRGWCMRSTMFLLPSDELAMFARGTARRPEYNLKWALARVASRQKLDRLLDDMTEILAKPRSRNDIGRLLKSQGYRLRLKAGGGWGDSRPTPFVELGGASFSVGFFLRTIGAREVICSGPSAGNESTFVRADKWLPHWRDLPQEQAEEELLVRYLKAFGPATVTDFALWIGLYVRDARVIWSRVAKKVAQVDVEGWKAAILQTDLPELERAKADGRVVRVLPLFDSFLLGHKSHLNMVDEANKKKVYRGQGWVSPVLLVDGLVRGVWSHAKRGDVLEVRVAPFSTLPTDVLSQIQEEASNLGLFLGCQDVKTSITSG